MKQSPLLALAVVVGVVGGALALKANRPAAAPVGMTATSSLPRFVDLGTTTCMPCKVMLGVMADLEKRYPGAMKVEFVDISLQPDEARRLGVQVIPTQIFYSPEGRELFRHVGVFKTEEIVAKWAELGFPIRAAGG